MSNTLGKKIKDLRQKKGLSLDDLSRRSGVSKAYLSQLENDESKKPSARILFDIATTLETSIAFLLNKEIRVRVQENIPNSLERAALRHEIPKDMVERLAAFSMRGDKDKNAYSEEDWIYLYETIKRISKSKGK